ncbi:Uncharacterised protein [Myroides odoratimimus]|uniref:Uncharacterized protein n=1 Tax=Myroides odoratimimus CCUG 10230 TaxID=883150 RepID=A0ABP2NCK3_9FLAO|nr:hypothetical protein HMPREF9712_01576 [Myroides odoratimimus CCUG 10230]STZ49156.1 Uncharacterised protein [Myroides odoratimimus]
MVQLKDYTQTSMLAEIYNFNTYMVQLKVILEELDEQEHPDFNTYMVQLKGKFRVISIPSSRISIPIWCS